jgi:hypothetical protein
LPETVSSSGLHPDASALPNPQLRDCILTRITPAGGESTGGMALSLISRSSSLQILVMQVPSSKQSKRSHGWHRCAHCSYCRDSVYACCQQWRDCLLFDAFPFLVGKTYAEPDLPTLVAVHRLFWHHTYTAHRFLELMHGMLEKTCGITSASLSGILRLQGTAIPQARHAR